jgi:peptidoglycan hydrolase-like protein with peptidoglycan-binding domain
VSIQATPVRGPAPLAVTFTAGGDALAYHWDFGDGAAADGPTAAHTFATGRWTTTLTGQSSTGETSTRSISITASALSLRAPTRAVKYARRSTFRGTLTPGERGVRVALVGPSGQLARARTKVNGAYVLRARLRRPGAYVARSVRGNSAPVTVHIVPKLVTTFVGSAARGSAYYFVARLVPASSGHVTVTVSRGARPVVNRTFSTRARIKLDTRRVTTYTVRVQSLPAAGYGRIARTLRTRVLLPRLAYGLRGAAIADLGRRLRALHYAAPADATFDGRMLDAVYAFQKVHGLPRTGVVEARFWSALAAATTPRPRYAGPSDHLEVDKGRQVLLVVRGGRVALVAPISTAGLPGRFTPVGRFSVYRKVTGYDPSPLGTLYDPMYFTGGYAIHGNPSVPPYPASHGCVRVPMWIAPFLYATTPYGQTVYVY